MFVIQWVYALANIVMALLLFFYIGRTSPGLPKGQYQFADVIVIACLQSDYVNVYILAVNCLIFYFNLIFIVN